MYPILLIRPLNKFKLDTEDYLDDFLSDVCSNNCTIEAFVGDNPKRSDCKKCKCFSSYHPCEYCEAKGHLLNSHDKSLKQKLASLHLQKNHIIAIITDGNEGQEEEIQTLNSILKSVTEAIKNLNKKKQ